MHLFACRFVLSSLLRLLMDLLDKVVVLEDEASQFGFRWETTSQIMHQIQSECVEVEEHLYEGANTADLQMEIGDLLHAVFSLCVFCKFNPRDTLNQSLIKFERRLNAVKAIAAEKGLDCLDGHSFEDLMTIWDTAKTRVG